MQFMFSYFSVRSHLKYGEEEPYEHACINGHYDIVNC